MNLTVDFIEKIVVFLINAGGVCLAFWVYLSDKRNKLNQWFAIMTFAVVLWVNFAFLGFHNPNQFRATIFYKLNFSAVALFLISAFHFYIVHFFREKHNYKILRIIVWSIGLPLIAILIFTNYVIKEVTILADGTEIAYGPANIIFNFYSLFIALAVLISLIKKYRVASRGTKLKIQYILIGTLLFVAFNVVFNIILPASTGHTTRFNWIGDYSAIILVGFTAYAIVKKRLFGIRVVITQVLVAAMAILLFVNILDSGSFFEYGWKAALFLGFLIFGWLLVKSILREIEQKEQLDHLASKLAATNINLEAAYKKLQKLDKAKSEFISISSHQLRTPLTAIKGYVSMLLEGDYGRLAKKAEQPLKNVFLSNERLIKLVNSLLNISRIEAGKLKFNLTKFSLEQLAEDLIHEFQPRAKDKKLVLELKKPAKLPQIKADKAKLREVLANLIDNAIKYTQQGNITLELKKQPGAVRILVSDTGEGLTREELNKLFQSFSRAGAGKRFWIEGTGLGLYVAKKFITMHQGKIWATSLGKGKGSTFHIELPLK